MNASLEEHARPSQIDRLLDLPSDLVEGKDVGLRVLRVGPIESAELAPIDADVGVVDVAVDDVGRDAGIVLAVADLVRRGAELEKIPFSQEHDGISGRKALSRERAVQDFRRGRHRLHSRSAPERRAARYHPAASAAGASTAARTRATPMRFPPSRASATPTAAQAKSARSIECRVPPYG